jgi:hypothetical protein
MLPNTKQEQFTLPKVPKVVGETGHDSQFKQQETVIVFVLKPTSDENPMQVLFTRKHTVYFSKKRNKY